MYVNTEECKAAGLDEKEVERIARNLSKWACEAAKLNIIIFGGSSGELRYRDCEEKGELKIASLDGNYDGGCGADQSFGDGLLRGEQW